MRIYTYFMLLSDGWGNSNNCWAYGRYWISLYSEVTPTFTFHSGATLQEDYGRLLQTINPFPLILNPPPPNNNRGKGLQVNDHQISPVYPLSTGVGITAAENSANVSCCVFPGDTLQPLKQTSADHSTGLNAWFPRCAQKHYEHLLTQMSFLTRQPVNAGRLPSSRCTGHWNHCQRYHSGWGGGIKRDGCGVWNQNERYGRIEV